MLEIQHSHQITKVQQSKAKQAMMLQELQYVAQQESQQAVLAEAALADSQCQCVFAAQEIRKMEHQVAQQDALIAKLWSHSNTTKCKLHEVSSALHN